MSSTRRHRCTTTTHRHAALEVLYHSLLRLWPAAKSCKKVFVMANITYFYWYSRVRTFSPDRSRRQTASIPDHSRLLLTATRLLFGGFPPSWSILPHQVTCSIANSSQRAEGEGRGRADSERAAALGDSNITNHYVLASSWLAPGHFFAEVVFERRPQKPLVRVYEWDGAAWHLLDTTGGLTESVQLRALKTMGWSS